MSVNPHSYQAWLESFAAEHGASAGTIHLQRGNDLELVAALNIPLAVLNAVRHVPHGKGMAGLAQVRKAPVQTCNLKEDDTGRIKPGAKAVDARAAVALPVLDATGGVRAVVGIAFMTEGEIPAEREQSLMSAAARLPFADA
ncbi:GAF domain-containing protein [Pyxidicoccus parkwayensis]|uniref:GAF domain-containing protein n=1 Tax=Pyxidicoccus parkwayensis TaxID=2813578 RepID=A0ABX7P9W2_9BACT|nr:GAF domain-containing protein [Pyxidicoccus parkwaysis]QSQ27208.1 GAF domain-containing protein [Pyxidicoccus parkwaysis]